MAQDLLTLRARYGISATEALHGMPAWEFDLLVRSGQSDDEPEAHEGENGALEPAVPEVLRGM